MAIVPTTAHFVASQAGALITLVRADSATGQPLTLVEVHRHELSPHKHNHPTPSFSWHHQTGASAGQGRTTAAKRRTLDGLHTPAGFPRSDRESL
jgi:hypothetical protein